MLITICLLKLISGENFLNNKDRSWANISLKNIKHNFKQIKNHVGKTKVMCIIKADAYGHGILQVAQTLENENADYFGVATLSEAVMLRQSGVHTPILLLGFFDEKFIVDIIENNITVAIYDFETAQSISNVCKKLGKTVKIHIKIDTGMSRLGFSLYNDITEVIKQIYNLEGIYIEGIFSHFAVSDNLAKRKESLKQGELFQKTIDQLENIGINIAIKHICASGGILEYPEFKCDMVRAGIVLYGYYPDDGLQKVLDLKPCMTLNSKIAQVKTIKQNEFISYGHTFQAKKDMKIAVISVGYADGYLRANSNKAYILVNGKKAPVVGRVCMDMCMVDVSDIENVKRGDNVIVFGYFDKNTLLGADKIADFCDTISYEVLCSVSKRVPRIYSFD